MRIILHCSASRFGNAALISKWHTQAQPNGRGWSNVGYHYVILNGHLSSKAFNKHFDGHIETGRPLDDDNMIEPFEIGAHTKGKNSNSVGVCFVGNSGEFTPEQHKSLHVLLGQLREQFGVLDIKQHSDFDPKKPDCAGLSQDYIDGLNRKYGAAA